MAKHPKHLAVLNAAAERAGWGTPAPKGVYRGLAQTMGFGSYVAACAEVSVNNAGELKIHRSSPPQTRATLSTRSRSRRRWKARSSMAFRPLCSANAR